MTAPILDVDREFLVERCRPLFEDVSGARFFVSGGTGFVGSWLLDAMTAAHDRLALEVSVTVLTRDPEGFRRRLPHLAGHPIVRLLPGDVRSFSLPSEGYDYVVHAAFDSSRPVDAAGTRSTIAGGTQRCLELARRSRVRRFLFVSSGAVYGGQPPAMSHVPEDRAGDPGLAVRRTDYGEAKYEAEQAAIRAGSESGFDVTIARCFAFVGPRLALDAHFAIGNFIRDALAGGPIRVRGDGSPVRSYLYAADLAVWLLTVLFRGSPSRAYNVGSDREVAIGDLARRVAAVLDPSLRVEVALSSSGAPADRYVPSTRRAREELGLEEIVGLDEAIRRTAAWWRGRSEPAAGA